MPQALPVFVDDGDPRSPGRPWWVRRGIDAWTLDHWRRTARVPAKPSKRRFGR